ncbi:uncharacterized protein LOC119830563 [Zerene cesonia]|uniref:uncharacterized protein LOC119830563 n=1 Tax=Zerene cesonia TaxID=33412 RepID=UPI0018E59506|nr:uncharacterized protein LOC119830563 [Zerene cesonia]
MDIMDAPSCSKQTKSEKDVRFKAKKELSLSSLILWNIEKVFEKNSSIDLKEAINNAYESLCRDCDIKVMLSQRPEDQHLACAVLAWQRLGHSRVESLYQFIHENRRKNEYNKEKKKLIFKDNHCYQGIDISECSKGVDSASFGTSPVIGPVVRLPVETKIVMRAENPCARHQPKKPQKNQKDIMNKIDAACCMDSACIQRLTELGATTEDLRKRAARLARREAERVELLERAEAAWKDLESGYQRRLKLAEEKEEDISKRINKLIEDRNTYKSATTALAQKLKDKGNAAEKERCRLTQLEKEVCNRACERLRLSEQAAQGDAAVAEQQCRAVQLDRELMYKEEQARRKVLSLESEVDSTRGLTIEAERAMRSELSALKEQITDVSKQLLLEEADNNRIKAELDDLRQEKAEIIQDLDGCKDMCDNRMQGRVDELKKKVDQLMELKNRVIECQCKLPLDVAVEVKRTPSLAALCHCIPEDKILDSCSCTSLRSQLLSNLLSDLFSGLQSELNGTGSSMPCQLLKCLEDRHNWDRATIVKANLRNFFSQLLIGELDIAIATSIEKYHAKWIGASCADQARMIPDPGEEENEGWQERAIERRAQKLATELAEQLFQERADRLTQRAKDIMTSGPPPCECKPQHNAAVYPCLVKTPIPPSSSRKNNEGSSNYLKRTIQDVTNLKYQIEDLKKDAIKKADLRQMEEKITKIIQRASKKDNKQISVNSPNSPMKYEEDSKNKLNTLKKNVSVERLTKKKQLDINSSKKTNKLLIYNQSGRIEKSANKFTNKKKEQSLAVNLCLCAEQTDKAPKVSHISASNWNRKVMNTTTQVSSSIKLSKPVTQISLSRISDNKTDSKKKEKNKPCPSECICLHKIPSNTSIDRLLEVLKKWKFNIDDCPLLNGIEKKSTHFTNTNSTIENNLEQVNYFTKPLAEKLAHNLSNIQTNDETFKSLMTNRINPKKSNEFLPVVNSEYMATINLDKSNNNCICTQNMTKQNLSDGNVSLRNFKCINTSSCQCVESVDQNIVQQQNFSQTTYEKESQLYSVKLPSSDYAKSSMRNEETYVGQNGSFVSKIVKDSKLFSFDCDYDIKFLGATLYDVQKNTEPTLNRSLHKNSILCNKTKNFAQDLVGNSNLVHSNIYSDVDHINQEPKVNFNVTSKIENDVKSSSSIAKNHHTSNQEMILPNVLEEVSNLIDNDFERLKKLCICEIKSSPTNENPTDVKNNKTNVHFETQENFQDQLHCIKEDTSISANPVMINKSCSAFENIPAYVQMVEKVTSCKINSLYVTDCDCRYTLTEPHVLGDSISINHKSKMYNNNNSEYCDNNSGKSSIRSEEILNDFERNLPYIGYTLNCSCDHFGCVCTKSQLETNDEKINFIWNSLQNDIQPKKLSYIMRAIPKARSELINISENYVKFNYTDMCMESRNNDDKIQDTNTSPIINTLDVCLTQTSIREEEGLALKNSFKNIKTSNMDTNTIHNSGYNKHDDIEPSCHSSFVTIPNACDEDDIETNKNTLYNSLFLPVDSTPSHNILESSDITLSRSGSQCDCNMVPICHVKMLVENIESNLKNRNQRDIEENDLIIPNKYYDSIRLGDKLERCWLEEYDRAKKAGREPSVWRVIIKNFWLDYAPGAILLIINTATRTIQPLLFTPLLSYWSVNATITQAEAGYYALAMIACNYIGIMAQHHNTLFVNRFSLKLKIAFSAVIYRKVLRMSQLSLGHVAAGKLVNILSNDLVRFDQAFMFLHYLWLVPIQVAVVLYLLYDLGDFAPYVGLFAVVLLILPVQAILTRLTASIRRKVAQRTDRRIKLMSEIINGIQVIKMYAWEKSFQKLVTLAREIEVSALKKSLFVRSVFLGFMMFAERTTLFITALTLILTGKLLTATILYPIKLYLNLIQMNLTFILPLAIASLSELGVSLNRIKEILVMDEREDLSILPKEKYKSRLSIMSGKSEGYVVELDNVSATWAEAENASSPFKLQNISLRLRKNKLCAVIGSVGSGKSSLLQVLLRELPVVSGKLRINGSVSYACQESWLYPATVRENITFGLPYDKQKYNEVCRVCCLLPDFKQFPYADLSLVGERGVQLSGGQRARINLARAIYREADIYLLDDPLSAVDANVGRQLFEECILGYLRGRTCILVTHQIHFIKAADTIVVLNDGAIENQGSFNDLIKSEKELSSLLTSLERNPDEEEVTKAIEEPKIIRGMSRVSVRSEEASKIMKEQILEAEERAKGNLKWEVIIKYLQSIRSSFWITMTLFSLLLTQAAATFFDYWLSYWTNEVDAYEQSLLPGEVGDPGLDVQMGPLTTGQHLILTGCTVVFIVITTHTRIGAFVVAVSRASKNLHNDMFQNLIKAVMRFFDTNPSGRVLNRFSKDMGAMDENLPRSFLETIQMYLFALSVLVLNATALPWTLIPTVILLVIFLFLFRWYLKAAQAVKRLESTTKSPVFGMLSSTITGLSTIRSSNSQDRLQKMFDDAQDLNTSAFFSFLGGSSAFGMYLDTIGLVYLGVIIAAFLFIDFGDAIPVGSVGLAVSQSMSMTFILQMAARITADLLAHMTSVERVLEYTNLPPEENMEDGPTQPPEVWPTQGNVEFENVYLQYGEEDPPVLKDLSFNIQGGWKVGIVGRTGAGKSSLIYALFRLTTIEGKIKIDGLDTHGIAKNVLRSKISIIPQVPVLFSATLRYNLDPFDTYSDEEIWRALEQVELKDAIPALDYKVTEGGSNFSVGQRQLLCLARAILRSNKILVMDEATANVDPQTDDLIQKTIRGIFSSCTVLTIAHRLNTIMDSDRVVVMDKGHVAEFDHPYILLNNPKSLFSFMVNETGENMSKVLFEVAKAKYFSENATAVSREAKKDM